jgi:gluconokinase
MAVWVFGGVAGSGKSSVAQGVAQALGCECLDADAFHPEANRQKMRSGHALDEADREPWLQALSEALAQRQGRDLVLAFPSLKRAHRERLAAAMGATPQHWAWLEASPATVEARLRQRGGFFPPQLVPSQFQAREADPQAKVLDAEQPLSALLAQALAWVGLSR